MLKRMAQDSSVADFWDTRYRAKVIPWDQGTVPRRFAQYLEARTDRPRTLIPGCGSGYEARLIVARGWPVLAIDFSAAAIDAARTVLAVHTSVLLEADFFAFAGDAQPFDLIYERAFLCALPPRIWTQYGTRVAQLVAPGGQLAGFFVVGATERGPPFSIARQQLDELLDPAFECIADESAPDSLAIFGGRERWMVWRRRSR